MSASSLNKISGSARSEGAPFSQRTKRALCLGVVAAFVLGLMAVPGTKTGISLHLDPGQNIELTGVSGPDPDYSAGELWGGGSELETCSVCSPSALLGKSGGQSTQPGQDVDPMLGNYTTNDDLFSVGAVGGDMAMNLTYDSGLATAEVSNGTPAGDFGYGWSSTMSGSVTEPAGKVVLNDENGAQTTFMQDTSADGCPVGDYQDLQKYTVPGSAYAYCAANRVDAQLGYFPAYGVYQLDVSGGREIDSYDALGQLADIATNATNSGEELQFTYNVSVGTNCPAGTGVTQCFLETDEADSSRHVVAEQNAGGYVLDVEDPFARQYQMSYDTAHNTLSYIYAPSPAGGDNSTSFIYSTTASAPYSRDLTQSTDPDGHQTNISYYTYGMVQQVEDPSANVTSYLYSDTDCATPSEIDCSQEAQSSSVSYADGEYDSDTYEDGLLDSDNFGPSGTGARNSWSFIYTEPPATDQDASTIETVIPPSGTSNATIDTDSSGNVVSYTDLAGNTTASMYNDNGANDLDDLCWSAPPGTSIASNVSCANPPTGATTYTYDSYGDELSQTDPLGHTTRNGYYENGLLCWSAPPTITAAGSTCTNNGTSPSGAPAGATTYVYGDNQGDVTSTTVPASPSPSKTTTTAYNLDDQVTYTIPPNGQGAGTFGSNPYETTDTYKSDGSLWTSTGPLSRTISYSYDAAGNALTSTDPAGVTTNAYDPDNRLCWSYRAAAAYGSNVCTSPPSSGATEYYPSGGGYNGSTDAPKAVTDPDGQTTTYAYADDRYPNQATTTTEASVSTNPQPNIITYTSYDDYENACMSGPVSTGAPGTCSELTGDTSASYDREGRLNSTYDASGNETTYAYPVAPTAFPTLPISMTTASGTAQSETTHYTYDADGDRITSLDPHGSTVTTGYDADRRPCFVAPISTSATCASPPSGGPGITLYGYDQAGQRASMTDNYGASGQITDSYSYDANGNLLSATNDNAQTTAYSYDDADDVTCTSYPTIASSSCTPGSLTGSYVTRAYNSAGQLSSTTDWLGNTVSYSNYNPLSEVKTITYPSVTGESLAYTYDADGNVTTIGYSGSAISALNGVTDSYTPNADNQVQSSSSLGSYSSSSDTYNSYGRLQQATNPVASGTGSMSGPDTYAYNYNGEIASDTPPGKSAITDNYNSADELTSVANPNNPSATEYNSYAYTTDGQRCLSVTGSSTYSASCGTAPSGSTVLGAYNYNVYGQLCWSGTTASTAGCSSPPTGATSYSYDGNNLRMTAQTGSNTSTFDWDTVNGGPTPLDISDGTNSYVYGPLLFGGTAPIEQISSAGVSFLASTPSGVQAVFGNPTQTSATNTDDQFTYASGGGGGGGSITMRSNSATNVTTTSSSLTLALTSAPSVGDLLVAYLGGCGGGWASGLPSGWAAAEVSASGNTDPAIVYKVATSADTTSYSYTFTETGYGGCSIPGRIEDWTGFTGTPTVDVVGDGEAGSAHSLAIPAGTTASASELALADVAVGGSGGPPSPSFASPALTVNTPSQSAYGMFTGSSVLTSATSFASFTASWSSSYSHSSDGVVVTFKSGSGGGGGGCPSGSGSGTGPVVTSVSPCTGSTSGGTSVTITGLNFSGVTAVKFGTTAASSFTVVSTTSITAVAPAGLAGSVDVTVSTGGMRLEELAAYSAYGVQTIQSGTDVTPFGFQGSYTDPSGLIYLIDRYYDPTTDQFLSVDPDLAKTGQPYAFSGDDPLDATDPNGLIPSCGQHTGACVQSAPGRPETVPAPPPPISTPSQNSTTEGFIHANPNSYSGESEYYGAGGAPGADRPNFYEYFVQSYQGQLETVPNEGSLLGNIVVGVNVCPIVCVGVQLQGGQVSVSGGGFGLFSRGVYLGYANRSVCSRESTSEFVSGGELFSGSVSTGVSGNNLVPSDSEVDFGVGAGGLPISGGSMHTFFTIGGNC